ncbi:hypothetical protein CYMTET_47510 [Cymbomonas tetramitiformis]|uniref:Uncharacterized protein n=1 Tax=Cymbomonas tetramitiformis TaxID=36881 RepID=A0AAE0EVX4_9CHLO|nr:hypothetical protein CYMTET_47510 [Cymbomonas tetramitiformis]|eukprot:gene21197-25464_t
MDTFGTSPSFTNFTVPKPVNKSGLAVRAMASAVITAPVIMVWNEVRHFTFPGKLIPDLVEVCAMEEGAATTQVGAVRQMTWKTGESQSHRLLALDDLEHKMSWEVERSSVPTEASAIISHIRLLKVTEDDFTFIEWTTEFSSDVEGDVVTFYQKANHETLQDIIRYFDTLMRPRYDKGV